MELREILSKCDHTLLLQTATPEDIRLLCDDGIKYGAASVCLPPCYVGLAKEYVGDRIPVCTVIGFPNGYATTAVKVFETEDAVKNGADEIDMVINVGLFKARAYDAVLSEMKAVRAACRGKVMKVIIETCLLTDEEKEKACELVAEAGADFVKTSTGFSLSGATASDVELLHEHAKPPLKVKAAGGIATLADAEDFINRGAERLGTSRIIKLAKCAEQKGDR